MKISHVIVESYCKHVCCVVVSWKLAHIGAAYAALVIAISRFVSWLTPLGPGVSAQALTFLEIVNALCW